MKLFQESYDRLKNSVKFETLMPLLEFISKTDPVHSVADYFIQYCPQDVMDLVIDKVKTDTSVMGKYPIKQIKRDLYLFTQDFSEAIKSLPRVKEVTVKNSPRSGFSSYIYVDLIPPKDSKLQNFIDNHADFYNHVTIRFSDHGQDEGSSYDDPDIPILYNDRSFEDVSKEVFNRLLLYIKNLEKMDSEELEKVKSSSKSESIKLRIREYNI